MAKRTTKPKKRRTTKPTKRRYSGEQWREYFTSQMQNLEGLARRFEQQLDSVRGLVLASARTNDHLPTIERLLAEIKSYRLQLGLTTHLPDITLEALR
jgi:hypothetical protein